MKTVLITGCSGLVGTYLIKKFLKENFIVVGVDLKPIQFKISYEYEDIFRYECLDLTADNNIRDVLNRHKPDVVVNAFGVNLINSIIFYLVSLFIFSLIASAIKLPNSS